MTDVLTNRNDNARSSTYLNESVLNPTNVNYSQFGKLFSRTVDGELYAQPLIVTDVAIPPRPGEEPPREGEGPRLRNAVYLATSRNWVYAYDADDPEEIVPFWSVNLGPPVPRADIDPYLDPPTERHRYLNFASEIGITSTPVIHKEGTGGTIYVVAKTRIKVAGSKKYSYRLHALDITTGQPVVPEKELTATAKARAAGGQEKIIEFSPLLQLNRPGLLLLDGVVYIAFGSHGDANPFYGWVMAHDAKTLDQLATYCTTPDWGEGGIWQSGNGLAGDAEGRVYFVSGNGSSTYDHIEYYGYNCFTMNDNINNINAKNRIEPPNFGCSIVKLELEKTAGNPVGHEFRVVDFYTPSDATAGSEMIEGNIASEPMNDHDFDLCAGPVLYGAPGRDGGHLDLVLGGGKNGRFYVLRRGAMGGWASPVPDGQGRYSPRSNPGAVMEEKLCNFHIHGAPVYWEGAPGGPSVYVWSERDHLKAFRYSQDHNGRFETSAYAYSEFGYPDGPSAPMVMPGGFLAVSANGVDPNTGIIWAAHPTNADMSGDANNQTVLGTLEAYQASEIALINGLPCFTRIWDSDRGEASADRLGYFAKFCPPVIANGKVYMATFSRELVVYGLLANPPGGPSAMPMPMARELAAPPPAYPIVWRQQTVGTRVQGSLAVSCERFAVFGSGRGLRDSNDQFHFIHQALGSGRKVTISARVLNVEDVNPLAMAGVMIRLAPEAGAPVDPAAPIDPAAPHATMALSASKGAVFLRRLVRGQDTLATLGLDVRPAYWVRVEGEPTASGTLRLTGLISGNGADWQRVGNPVEIALPARGPVRDDLQVGLIVTAHDDRADHSAQALNHSTFDAVEIGP